jgi:CspA family cold shock protein
VETATQREIGTVNWFNAEKGYGFIRLSDNPRSRGDGIFCHYSEIASKDQSGAIVPSQGYRTLTEGQPVEFEIHQCVRGFEARRVVAITE